ncbi:Putative peptidoglycan binding domain-containing protein [Mesobacillus persicus]|uniref:Putative peptidoglycan binding domain-containing protein n=1 Tax=Mesobacillus persicus TaxID=930146 RepID=A0A1H8IE00_9BACI|nr:L,D-transpeptidase family protein [Mesobacillus persicus]SEN66406.1 Putative peptidoglycan binding domain-containing protein [Mesobacillus persicus]
MGQAVEQTVDEVVHSRKKTSKWYKNWKIIISIVLILITLIILGMSYYQANHFNANITINTIDVGGLTADEALAKLQASNLKNEIYIGDQQILDGQDRLMGLSEADLPEVEKLLKSQYTFFPSFKAEDFSLLPSEQDLYRSKVLKKALEQELVSMNETLEAPIDSQAILQDGKIIVTESNDGQQYDIDSLLESYDNHDYTSEVRLEPIHLLPIKEDSEMVKNQEKKLQELLDHTVDYKVQDQVHSLKGSDVIKNATVSGELKVKVDPKDLQAKLTEINDSQSTLGKDFTFKTHSGSVISVKGKGYGWALNVEKETAQVQAAFEKGESSTSASNIYGNGWSNEGYGYDTLTNDGIGDTYAEVSIAEQRMWLYKDGKEIFTTHVVTGKRSTGEDTNPGVWYILYKRTPYTLTGSAVGNPDYSVDVSYWAPFTNGGQGFHDASWRGNWSSTAYLTGGSGGCVNVPPGVMSTVYNNLSVYQPVVIY